MTVASNGIFYEQGGVGEPVVLLLHGMSCTGAVFRGLTDILDRNWPGRWIAPDFRGHGRSPHAGVYGMELHAADVAALVAGEDNIYLVGHSMGAQCALVLASGWFGFTPRAVITIGLAVDWGNEARDRIDRLVHTPVRWFESEAEARERFVRVNGLEGFVDPAGDVAATGISRENGRWRLACDNRVAMVVSSSAREAFAAANAPVTLVRGEHDPMVTQDEHRSLDGVSIAVPGCGHNVHVERPDAIWDILRCATAL